MAAVSPEGRVMYSRGFSSLAAGLVLVSLVVGCGKDSAPVKAYLDQAVPLMTKFTGLVADYEEAADWKHNLKDANISATLDGFQPRFDELRAEAEKLSPPEPCKKMQSDLMAEMAAWPPVRDAYKQMNLEVRGRRDSARMADLMKKMDAGQLVGHFKDFSAGAIQLRSEYKL